MDNANYCSCSNEDEPSRSFQDNQTHIEQQICQYGCPNETAAGALDEDQQSTGDSSRDSSEWELDNTLEDGEFEVEPRILPNKIISRYTSDGSNEERKLEGGLMHPPVRRASQIQQQTTGNSLFTPLEFVPFQEVCVDIFQVDVQDGREREESAEWRGRSSAEQSQEGMNHR